MNAQLRLAGANAQAVYYCPQVFADGCECRKPKPGMFHQATRELSVDRNADLSEAMHWILRDVNG